MKLYCYNCKHNRSCYGVEYTTCKPIKCQEAIIVKEDDYYSHNHITKIKKQMEKAYRMDELNKDNNCKHYKRKWWKFWIKE